MREPSRGQVKFVSLGQTFSALNAADASLRESSTIRGRCPDCARRYDPGASRFLYSDEHGTRCPECGSILVEEAAPPDGVHPTYRLIIPEHLEDSEIHWKLRKLAREDGARVLVDHTGSSGIIRLER